MQKVRYAALALLLVLLLPEFAGAQAVGMTGPVMSVTDRTAVLSADVNPNGAQTNAWFEYGFANNNLYNRGITQNLSGYGQIRITETLTGLQPNTLYYYRVVTQSGSYGTQYGSVLSFTTSGYGTPNPNPYPYPNPYPTPGQNSPTVTLLQPTSLGRTSVSLHGRIYANGSDTTTWFEYGTNASVGTRSESRFITMPQTGLDLNFHLGGLRPGTTYYYRLAAQNSYGVSRTETNSFTTLGSSSPAPAPPPTPTPTTTPTSTGGGFNSALILLATVDETQPPAGSEFNYILEYRNDGSNAASGTVLRATLPNELEFVMADVVPRIESRTLSFDLGTVRAGDRRTIRVRLRVKADADPVQVSVPALLTYRTPRNEERSATANVSLSIREEQANATSTPREFGGLRWYTWLFLLVLLLIGLGVAYVLYRYGKSKRALGG